MSKRAVYDKYKGARKLHLMAQALTDLLCMAEHTQISIIHSADKCPKCESKIRELRQEPRFRRIMAFCPECHFFILWNRDGKIKTFADGRFSDEPAILPPSLIKGKPLSRSIHNHIRSIRKEDSQ